MSSISVLVPAHNEEDTIRPVLESLVRAKKQGIIERILVVDDGSEDRTSMKAREMGVEVIRIEKNSGKAFAFCRGVFHLANNPPEYLVVLDADLERFDSSKIKKMIDPLTRSLFTKMAIDEVYIGSEKLPASLSGQRAFRFADLTPLLSFNAKWMQYLGYRRDPRNQKNIIPSRRAGYGLEQGLNEIFHHQFDIVDAHFQSNRWRRAGTKQKQDIKKVISIHAQRWALAKKINQARENKPKKARNLLTRGKRRVV